MFGNGMPDTLPESYGNDMQVESFVQTPGEVRALRKFVKSADGTILPPGPTGLDAEVQWIPKGEQFVSLPHQNPGSPWAPQPPYVGAEMAQLVSNTPYRRGQGVPVQGYIPQSQVQQEYRRMYNGAYGGHDPTHFSGHAAHQYGVVPDAPLTMGSKDGWFSKPVNDLKTSLLSAGATVHPEAGKGGVYDDKMILAVRDFQQKWNKSPTVTANTALAIQESGVFDKSTELALRQKLGENVDAKAGGGLTGDDWIGIGGLGIEVLKLFKDEPEKEEEPAASGSEQLGNVEASAPSMAPYIIGGVALLGLMGVVLVMTGKDKDDD